MSTGKPTLLDQDDVTVEDLERPECDDCCAAFATKIVMLNLRMLGQSICIGAYCDECAIKVTDKLWAELPEPVPEAS